MKDYYKILGISRTASQEEIKKAYHRLAHQHHPDKAGKAGEEKFKEINEAYQVLGNPQKKAEYDRFGERFEGAPGFDFGFGGFDFGDFQKGFDFGDIFENIFEFGFARPGTKRQKRGRDLSLDLELSFEEAVFGGERRVLVRKNNLCDECKGSGGEPGAKTIACSVCRGSGTIRETRKTIFGTFTQVVECEKCAGKGSAPEKLCKICRGSGIVRKEKEIRINIPPGIESGEVIKLSGEGEVIKGGIPGDIYVRIHIKPHPVFRREGHNLFMEFQIPFSEAILGGEEKIDTLDGFVKLRIPQGIDSGEILRIKEKGVFLGRGNRGDLLVKIIVKTPKKLTKRLKDLAEELKKEGL